VGVSSVNRVGVQVAGKGASLSGTDTAGAVAPPQPASITTTIKAIAINRRSVQPIFAQEPEVKLIIRMSVCVNILDQGR
jgi:hypothetical protein